jgi:hypothetical protein
MALRPRELARCFSRLYHLDKPVRAVAIPKFAFFAKIFAGHSPDKTDRTFFYGSRAAKSRKKRANLSCSTRSNDKGAA